MAQCSSLRTKGTCLPVLLRGGTRLRVQRAVAIDGIERDSSKSRSQHDNTEKFQSGRWGGQVEEEDVSFGRMLRFIIPTLGTWLAWPILSLVDAGVIGE